MSEKQSPFASAVANYEARKAAQEAEAIQQQESTSPERGTVAPIKSVEEKAQERRKLAPNLKLTEQASPVRVQPRPKNKIDGEPKLQNQR